MRIVFPVISLVLLVGSASAQSTAENSFGLSKVIDATSTLEIGLVRASSDGQVLIYDRSGQLLGLEAVKAGANPDVRVNLGAAPRNDVTAVLQVNGEAVASRDIEIIRDGGHR